MYKNQKDLIMISQDTMAWKTTEKKFSLTATLENHDNLNLWN